MNPDHLDYAQSALDSFIFSAIQRIAHSGDFVYRFTISEAEIKSALGVSRVKATMMEEYAGFFKSKGLEATYDSSFSAVDIVLNLNTAVLNARQAAALGDAMGIFHAERT